MNAWKRIKFVQDFSFHASSILIAPPREQAFGYAWKAEETRFGHASRGCYYFGRRPVTARVPANKHTNAASIKTSKVGLRVIQHPPARIALYKNFDGVSGDPTSGRRYNKTGQITAN